VCRRLLVTHWYTHIIIQCKMEMKQLSLKYIPSKEVLMLVVWQTALY
jgi:hypothetical protein